MSERTPSTAHSKKRAALNTGPVAREPGEVRPGWARADYFGVEWRVVVILGVHLCVVLFLCSRGTHFVSGPRKLSGGGLHVGDLTRSERGSGSQCCV